MKNIHTVNIPLKSEFDKDIKALKQRRRKNNICKYCLGFVGGCRCNFSWNNDGEINDV